MNEPPSDVSSIRCASAARLTTDVRVRQALCGKRAVETLDNYEREHYFDLVAFMETSPEAVLYCAQLRATGGGVGCDRNGNLVKGLPGGCVRILQAGPVK